MRRARRRARFSAPLPLGSTNTQAEWFAGTSPQHLATAVSGVSCPATITLANSIDPAPGYESNVAPFGLIQIDGEQFTYFAKSIAANPTPANTLYHVQCAQNGTGRTAHAAGATVVPLNNFQPGYPWPVTPTVNAGDTTPGHGRVLSRVECGQRGVCLSPGDRHRCEYGRTGSWNANARIENLSFYPWPNEINGERGAR